MPLKRDFDGDYAKRKLISGARQLIAERDEIRQRELSGQPAQHTLESDTVTVVQTARPPLKDDPLREPQVRWETTGTMPLGLPHIVVYAAQSDAFRNKQSLRELLERRLRRSFRAHLLAAKLMPEADALARVMRLRVHVADVSLILKPGDQP